MTYENVEFAKPNFCIGPKSDNYASIDHTSGANGILRFKNSTGTLVRSYSLDTGVLEIRSIEYPGPRNVSPAYADFVDDMFPFFTLERNSSSTCTIREWRLDSTLNNLNLENTITKTLAHPYYYNCWDMSVEYYLREFDGATTTGTGRIKINTYDNVEIGDRLLLGPSSDVTDLNGMEWVEVTSISGGWVYIDSLTSSGAIAPINEYQDEDDITYTKAIYLFSDVGYNSNTIKGSIYKLHPYTGAVLGHHESALYMSNTQPSRFSATAWSVDYDAIGMVRGSNLLYVNPNDNYNILKSQALTNIDDDDVTLLPVYDLVFDNSAIYRLQNKITLRDNNGNKTTTSWSTYNYHQDTISPYTFSIDITAEPNAILAQEPAGGKNTTTLTAVVRDNFGVGIPSKDVEFFKSGETGDSFTPIDGKATTNSSGVAQITYTARDYPVPGAPVSKVISITARTDGASNSLGAPGSYNGWIWDGIELLVKHQFNSYLGAGTPTEAGGIIQKPTLSGAGVDPFDPSTVDAELKSSVALNQLLRVSDSVHLKGLSKFQFPGGHWGPTGAPTADVAILEQLEDFESDLWVNQIDNEFDNSTHARQIASKSNDLQISNTYISRHLLSGHKDDVDIDQFNFISNFIPPQFSEKNPVNTNISGRLLPFGFTLNQSTFVMRVREISYAGDTGFIDVTDLVSVTPTGDPGDPPPLGIDFIYNPVNNFHHNGIVYVEIEVYDQAPTPNIIITEYWFKIIPDFKAPYIDNEDPAREEEDVALDTNISFDIFDAGVGVNIDTLEFYVNNRLKTPITSTISGGYHVSYSPADDFFYGETVEITVKVDDASDNQNTLYDTWRFYCVGSTGPWIDRDSFVPQNCAEGVDRHQSNISVNVLAIEDTGVDRESIMVHIGGKERDVKIRPIIYRVS